jgi:predicted nucleic acid-binding protein
VNAIFVDTSCLVAIVLDEPDGAGVSRRLESCDELLAANLLEAELRSVFQREGVPTDHPILRQVSWVLPNRPLSREITTVLSVGLIGGADLWHLACALWVTESPRDLPFVTLDHKQQAVARQLGFPD